MPLEKQRPLELEKLIETLNKAGIKYILVGGMAAAAQGSPVLTFDLDIVHEKRLTNIQKIKDLLISIKAYQRHPDNLRLKPDFDVLQGTGHMLLSTQYGPMDILGAIEKGLGYEELIHNINKIEFHGFEMHVLDLKTLVELKRESKRPEDKQRLKILEETLDQITENDENIRLYKKNGYIEKTSKTLNNHVSLIFLKKSEDIYNLKHKQAFNTVYRNGSVACLFNILGSRVKNRNEIIKGLYSGSSIGSDGRKKYGTTSAA